MAAAAAEVVVRVVTYVQVHAAGKNKMRYTSRRRTEKQNNIKLYTHTHTPSLSLYRMDDSSICAAVWLLQSWAWLLA
jgi:hypothetical protein